MDNKEYLKQISRQARPEKKPKPQFLKSPLFKVIVGGVVAIVAIMIFGSILGAGKTSLQDKNIALKLHLDNTLSAISEYQPSVKSSDLRSSSASLYSVLSNTNRELTAYMVEAYEYNENNPPAALSEEATLHGDELSSDLFEAKINGILDRIYARKMAYEISLIMNEETAIYAATSNEPLREIINTSYNSLNNLYDKFNDFSETK